MKLETTYQSLRLILGDQLDAQHSWFEYPDDSVLLVIAELDQEATYTKHHIQKLSAFFCAMEHFASELRAAGHHVLHLTLDDTAAFRDLPALLQHLCERYSAQEVCYQRPDEYRLLQQLDQLELQQNIHLKVCESEHFILPFDELGDYIQLGRHNRMETFYRKMRTRFGILMDGDKPLGGRWNYDGENREKLRPADLEAIPEPLVFTNPVTEILNRIDRHSISTIGKPEQSLPWPVTRTQCLQLLAHFCRDCLPQFGRFQDAMTSQHQFKWSLYHSRLSFGLNCKMLRPMEVIEAAVDAYTTSGGAISLPQIEGFVRQVLGWREYIRAVYWTNMPGYAELNALAGQRKLPDYFWTGNTRMECVKQAIEQSLERAYAHHIQRLMITGNFCLITGIDPDQVDAWYLGIYIDAIEWVEMPNTRGMSQFADGGLVATKPYSAGGNYINKMSDYCKSCHYSVKEKVSDRACPFNSLYWGFMLRHRDRFAKNPRIGMVYRNWDKQAPEVQQATLARADWCLEHLDEL